MMRWLDGITDTMAMQCLKELIKDMVGVHVHVYNLGNGGGENGKEEFEEPPQQSLVHL